MESAKKKIEQAVAEYVTLFPDEYNRFIVQMNNNRLHKNNDWAELEGSDVVQRKLYEKPETLHAGIRNKLNEEEWDWLHACGEYENDHRGPKWFMDKFMEFRVTKTF